MKNFPLPYSTRRIHTSNVIRVPHFVASYGISPLRRSYRHLHIIQFVCHALHTAAALPVFRAGVLQVILQAVGKRFGGFGSHLGRC